MQSIHIEAEENENYGKTSNYLILEKSCNEIAEGTIIEEDFLETLNWMLNLIGAGDNREIDEVMEHRENVSEELTATKRLYSKATAAYKQAITELKEYLADWNPDHLSDGLSMALDANKQLLDLQEIVDRRDQQLEEAEKFYKEQIIKRNMTGHIFSTLNYGLMPSGRTPSFRGMLDSPKNKTETFSIIPIFNVLSEEQMEKISRRIKYRRCEKGTILFKDGDMADEVYIIKSGQVSLYKTIDSEDIMDFAILSTGDFFGEMGAISDSPRSLSSKISSETAELYTISKDDFLYILRTYPEVNLNLTKILCQRIKVTNKRLLEYAS